MNNYSEKFRKQGREILEKSHKGYELVCQRSRHVSINDEALEKFAIELKNEGIKRNNNWLNFSIVDFSKLTVEEAFELLILFHSVNFCYWGNKKWTILTNDDKRLDGSQAMLYVCYNILKDNNFEPSKIAELSAEEIEKYLKGNVKILLLYNRYLNIKNLYGKISYMLSMLPSANFTYDLFKDLDKDDETLLGFIIKNFSSVFNDTSKYYNNSIYFYKRAQLLVSDIMNLLNSRGVTNKKPDNLLGCADYKIPQILEAFHVLEYDEELKDILRAKEPIPLGYRSFEIEIRANTLKAIEILSKKTSLTRMEVNDMIWLMSQNKNKKFSLPYHRVITTAY